uniref:Uncharacterized protein n=1 Tax=Myotis myotis TaxID=51298 RepID=A0A7J7YE71_MYOMY|nr:hypothetical protein mMyoMyo1_011171 [Myotis myotis]
MKKYYTALSLSFYFLSRASGHLMGEGRGRGRSHKEQWSPETSPRPCPPRWSQSLKQQQQHAQRQARDPHLQAACGGGGPVTQFAITAGKGEAVGDALIGDRLFKATVGTDVHGAFVDDGAEARGHLFANEALLVIATGHGDARVVGGVGQLTEDAVHGTWPDQGQSHHQQQ